MKKAIYLLGAISLFIFPGLSNAQSFNELSPTEVFCANASAKSGNAMQEITKLTKSRGLSADEKQVLIEMSKTLDRSQTIENICSPAEL